MKILIKANTDSVAARVKELLESYGKGMKIFTRDDGISYYACVICVGETTVWQQPDMMFRAAEPATDEEWDTFDKLLWRFYRDNLKDSLGVKCWCGLHDYCHCH